MIFVSQQLSSKPLPELEQQLSAYQQLTQSLSEEFDRASELQAQTLQTSWESWNLFCVDLTQLKDPQELFTRAASQAHACAAQAQQYLHAVFALQQQIQEKIIALGQTISPMMTESLIEISTTIADDQAKQEQIQTPNIIKDLNTVDIPVAPKPIRAKRKINTAKADISTVETVTVTEVSSQAPTPKVRKVKPTEKIAEVAAVAKVTEPTTTAAVFPTVKKSAVVGLPAKPAAKSGFAGAAGQPEFKAKSSKATGAKKRVRQ
ncbi:hypothetical protein [Undibacterium sp.]|uniref:hypothetical protein n=1 Tax=Undibacterium sp. TaxID=1914977 RepID=UPI003753B734